MMSVPKEILLCNNDSNVTSNSSTVENWEVNSGLTTSVSPSVLTGLRTFLSRVRNQPHRQEESQPTQDNSDEICCMGCSVRRYQLAAALGCGVIIMVGVVTSLLTQSVKDSSDLAPTSSPVTTIKPTRVSPLSTPSNTPSASPVQWISSLEPSPSPSFYPSMQMTNSPSVPPTFIPTPSPTLRGPSYSQNPTQDPSSLPASKTAIPSHIPSPTPSNLPRTSHPSHAPSSPFPFSQSPSWEEKAPPSVPPTPQEPSSHPTGSPSTPPSAQPSLSPTIPLTPSAPSSSNPLTKPTQSLWPSQIPTQQPSSRPTGPPSTPPSVQPSLSPTIPPSADPTLTPTAPPSSNPLTKPTQSPWPSQAPTQQLSSRPTGSPSTPPSVQPSLSPTRPPSATPTTQEPTAGPSATPSTTAPSSQSSVHPTIPPSTTPTAPPSTSPSSPELTSFPTETPSTPPPSSQQSPIPTLQPSANPTTSPSFQPTRPSTGSPITPAPVAEPPSSQPIGWVQLGDDIDGDETGGDERGISVALSSDGMILAVGAWRSSNRGRVKIYKFSIEFDEWVQLGGDLDGQGGKDIRFGRSVALSGDGTVLAVGTERQEVNGNFKVGRAEVFEWNEESWVPKGSHIDGKAEKDQFGTAIDLANDGMVVAVGANSLEALGSVRIYEWRIATADWQQLGDDLLGTSQGDSFGYAVSLSSDGSIVACGARWDGRNSAGRVRIFKWNGASWNQRGPVIDGDEQDFFGTSVALSGDGDVVAVGASRGNKCKVYRYSGDWTQVGQELRGEGFVDSFGSAVSLSSGGDVLVVGASGHDSRRGHVTVYQLTPEPTVWVKVGDILGESLGDASGATLAMSHDGLIVAVGAPNNDGVNGEDSGQVRVFELR